MNNIRFNELKKGLSLKFFGEISPDIIKICSENFDCIELSFPPDYWKQINFINQKDKYKKILSEYNIKVWSLHIPYGEELDISSIDNEKRKKALNLNIEYMRVAKYLGINLVVIHPSSEPILEENRIERINSCKDSLIRLSELAKKLELKIAVENLPRTCLANTSQELIEIVKNIKDIGICFDTNHSLKEDNIEFLKHILESNINIYTLHISDYDFINERHQLPGYGVNNWKEIIALLEQANYIGPIMYEINKSQEINIEDIKNNQYKLINNKGEKLIDKKRPYIGVDAIFINEKEEILLIHRTGKNFNGYWGLVSGMIEDKEEVKDALKREVLEEIGVELKDITYTGKYYDTIGRHPTKTVICLPHICTIKKGVPRPVSECDEVKWFTKEEIHNMELSYDHKKMLQDLNLI